MRQTIARTALAAAFAALVPQAAPAFDITGTWTGKWKCVGMSNGQKSTSFEPSSSAAVTQVGDVFGATIDGDLDYAGIAIADGGNAAKGAVGIIHCGTGDALATQPAYSEFGNWKVSTRGDKGTLSGVTVWSSNPQHIATCKYKYKRTDTTDPGVPTVCP